MMIIMLDLRLAEHDKPRKISYRTSCQFITLAIRRFVVARLSIAEHSHYIREHHAWPIVLVRIEENTKSFKFVDETKDGPPLRSLFRDPQCHTVAKDVSFSVYFELEFDLPDNRRYV